MSRLKVTVSSLLSLVMIFMSTGISHALTESDLKDILNKNPYYSELQTCDVSSAALSPQTNNSSSGSNSAEDIALNKPNAASIFAFFISKGLTPEQAAGFLGNIQSESASTFDPRIVEGMTYSDSIVSGKGYGLSQWTTSGRQQGLQKFADNRNKSVSDLNIQLEYIWAEITGNGQYGILDELKTATTVASATDIVLNKYEQPAERIRNLVVRTRYAEAAFIKFGNSIGSVSVNGSCLSGDGTSVVNCQSATGNAKLVCAAEQNLGTMYCYTDNHNGHLGNCGHGVKNWLADVQKYGKDSKYYATECSGFVDIAFYLAYGVDFSDYCSSSYPNDTKNFKRINLTDIQPGDLVIEHINQGCGTDNHVAIVKSYNKSTNKLVTLESTAGRNDKGEAGISGVLSYRVLGKDFDGAVRYIGSGLN